MVFLLLILINICTGIQCTTETCNIKPLNDYDIIECNKNTINCNIDCSLPNSCKDLQLYSLSQNTNIECSSIKSCNNSLIYIGNYNNIYKSIKIICNGYNSCNNIKIYINGIYSNDIIIISNGFNSLVSNSLIECNSKFKSCLLECKNNCNGLTLINNVKCFGNCDLTNIIIKKYIDIPLINITNNINDYDNSKNNIGL